MFLKLLNEEQIKEGDLALLDYKPLVKISDFAKKIGGGKTWVTSTNRVKTKPYPRNEGAYEQVVVDEFGSLSAVNMDERYLGIRPAVDFSEIEKDCVELEEKFGLTFVQYGEYPQSKVSNTFELEKAFKDGTLKETTKEYSIPNPIKKDDIFINPWHINPTIEHQDEEESFIQPWKPRPEIQFNHENGTIPPGLYFPPGVRRINPNNHILFNIFALDSKEPYKQVKEYELDGKKYVKVDNEWFKVEPITWRVDKEKNIAVTENVISGGVPINCIDKFLSENLTKEINQAEVKEDNKSNIDNLKLNIDQINVIIQIGFTLSDGQTKTEEKEEVKEENQKVKVKAK